MALSRVVFGQAFTKTKTVKMLKLNRMISYVLIGVTRKNGVTVCGGIRNRNLNNEQKEKGLFRRSLHSDSHKHLQFCLESMERNGVTQTKNARKQTVSIAHAATSSQFISKCMIFITRLVLRLNPKNLGTLPNISSEQLP